MLDALYALFIAPLEFVMQTVLGWAHGELQSYGWAIVVMSLVVNTLILPIYNKAEGWQEEERRIKKGFADREAMIKRAFKGQERFTMLATMRRQAGYTPLLAMRSSVGFLLQIPFFIAAYHLLSHMEALRGVSFGVISDLGSPDGLIALGGLSINALPLMMTAVNLLSAFVYTASLSRQDKIQLYALSAIFLVLLYDSPAALTLYWTLNNVYSLGKNEVEKTWFPRFESARGMRFDVWLGFAALALLRRLPRGRWLAAAGAALFIAAGSLGASTWHKNDVGMVLAPPVLSVFLLLLAGSSLLLLLAALRAGSTLPTLRRAGAMRWTAAVWGGVALAAALWTAFASDLEPWYLQLKVPTAGAWCVMGLSAGALLLAALLRLDEALGGEAEPGCERLWNAASLLLVTMASLALPLVVYASDPSSVTNGLMEVFPLQICTWVVLMLVFWQLGRMLTGRLKTAASAVLTVCTLASALYAFVFVGDYGVIMDGRLDNPGALGGGRVADLLIYAACAATLWALWRWAGPKRLAAATGGLGAVCVVLSLGYASAVIAGDDGCEPAFASKAAPQKPAYADALYAFSESGRNLVVIVFDMFTGDHFPKLYAENPDVAEAMTGFVWFKDTLSVGSGTGFGLPTATGGNRYSVRSINADNEGKSFLELYGESYANIANLLGPAWRSAVSGWVWPPKAADFKVKPEAVVGHAQQENDWFGYYYADALAKESAGEALNAQAFLFSVALFKMSPYSGRHVIYRRGAWLMPSRRSLTGYYAFAPMRALIENSHAEAGRGDTFRYFYFEGTHSGFYFDEAGRPSAVKHLQPAGWREAHTDFEYNHYLAEQANLKALARWLQWLKKAGLYDRTRIVVVSDHGGYDTHTLMEVLGRVSQRGREGKDSDSNPGLRYPLLLWKDFGAQGELRVDETHLMTNGDGLDLLLKGIVEVPPKYSGDWTNPNRIRWYESTNDWGFEKGHIPANEYEVRGTMFNKDNWNYLGEAKP